MVSEAPIGIYMWLFLMGFVLAYVVGCDWWLHANGYEYMTTEFKEGVVNPVWGPLITAAWFALFVGLTFHFYFAHIAK